MQAMKEAMKAMEKGGKQAQEQLKRPTGFWLSQGKTCRSTWESCGCRSSIASCQQPQEPWLAASVHVQDAF